MATSPFLLRFLLCGAVLLAALFFTHPLAATPKDYGGYRPHYQGFGVKTRGGRGGVVYKVTNLNDSGPGSLRAALVPGTCTPRFVIFEISGTITLSSDINITCPFLTLAGQTAPSPGILVRGAQIIVSAHDIVVQHMRFRIGAPATIRNHTPLLIRTNAYNIVLDHNSFSWGNDKNLDIHHGGKKGERPRDIALFDNIISEGLFDTGTHPEGRPHSTCFLIGPAEDGTVTGARNLIAHCTNRFPWVQGGQRAMWVNNLLYNARKAPTGQQGGFARFMDARSDCSPYWGWPIEAVHVGNVTIPGPNTVLPLEPIEISISPAVSGTQIYLADNTGAGMTPQNQWGGVKFECTTETKVKATYEPAWYKAFNVTAMPSANVEQYVLRNAGARPLDRDVIDERVVADVAARQGAIIDHPADRLGPGQNPDGWPKLAVNRRPLAVPSNPHDVVDAVGRTRIEAWLEGFARELEPSQGSDAGTSQPQRPGAPRNLRLTAIAR